jgi:hypothetical protein
MELTYMVRGADGKEYGPVTLERLTAWIKEGRLTAQHEVKRSDMGHWTAATAFSELQPVFSSLAASVVAPPRFAAAAAPVHAGAALQLRSGASWFYWIAGLSLVNSVMSLTGSGFGFALALGVTQILDSFARGLGPAGKGVALLLDVLVAGLFVFFGVFASKAHTWAFVLGMILFALDTLIVLLAQAWLSVALHGLALYFLFRGFQACRQLRAAS